nr:EOG090X0J7Y [Triops cancriformis]
MDKYWTDSPSHYDRIGFLHEKRVIKFPKNLNFVALANDEEDEDFGCSKKKAARDPMSHRIIEKRRRDRMNNCLADLSRLLPAAYLKKGRGRIEKTEIIEMAIKHMRHLQVHACQQVETCEVANSIERQANNTDQQYRLGYSECMSEMMHFLVEVEGFFAGDALCSRLMNHLQMHGEKITRGAVGFQQMNARSSSASSGSSSADYLRNGTSSSGSSAESSKFIPRSGTSSSSNSSSKSMKPQSSSDVNLKESHVKNEETDSSAGSNCPRLSSHTSSGIDSEDTDRSSYHCTTNPSSTSPSDNNNQDSSDSGANIQQKDLKDLFLADSGFTSTGASSHGSSTRLDDTGLYKKYKTDIQQRFTAEEHQSHEELDDVNDCEASKRRKVAYKTHSLHEQNKYDFKAPVGSSDTSAAPIKPLRFDTRPRPSPLAVIQNGTKAHTPERSSSAYVAHLPEPEPVSSTETANSNHNTGTGSLPVFVLHPQGSFYVPTLIEAPVVTPLLSGHVQSPVLHPVTIHVSFGYSAKVIGARPEVQPCPAVVPAADPVVGIQDNVVPVHPLPARECDVPREVPPTNSARWSYLMANAKRP